MIKLFVLTFLFSFAHAEGMESNAMDGIFKEALFFFVLIGIMAIVSFIISKRNANKYELENPLQDRKDAQRKSELIDKYLNTSYINIYGKEAALSNISKLLEINTLNEEEFKILKDSLDNTSEE